jgi:hypothetical protein
MWNDKRMSQNSGPRITRMDGKSQFRRCATARRQIVLVLRGRLLTAVGDSGVIARR